MILVRLVEGGVQPHISSKRIALKLPKQGTKRHWVRCRLFRMDEIWYKWDQEMSFFIEWCSYWFAFIAALTFVTYTKGAFNYLISLLTAEYFPTFILSCPLCDFAISWSGEKASPLWCPFWNAPGEIESSDMLLVRQGQFYATNTHITKKIFQHNC